MKKQNIRFPKPPKRDFNLRKKLNEPSEFALRSKKRIDNIIEKTKAPWGGLPAFSHRDLYELEKSLLQLQKELAVRERKLREGEMRLIEREREVYEEEGLLTARFQLLEANKKEDRRGEGALSKETQRALEGLKAELDDREESLREAKALVKEREAFLEKSENTLFGKVQEQQEKETELEQLAEELERKRKALEEREKELDS